MRRIFRLAVIAVGIASGYYIARGVANWQAERRRRHVFPAEEADTLLHPLRQRLTPAHTAVRRFHLRPGQTVLEVGPGPGYYTIDASRAVGENGRLICLDVQRGMIERLNKRLRDADSDANVHTMIGDAMSLPLRTGSVDRAFLVTVLGEVPRAEVALAELRRVLRDGGVLAIAETLRDPDYVRTSTLRKMCTDAGFEQAIHYRSLLGYTAVFRAV